MSKVPTKVANRIRAGLKRFQPIIANAKSRDINESDTVTIVMELLSEIFGYDKFVEITSEHAIKGTFCDLAIKLDGELTMLVEVKAIGSDPKAAFVKQAVDYAANQGVDWVILTNGDVWHVYKMTFTKPIDAELVARVVLSELTGEDEHIESLWMLSKEGWNRSALADHHARCQAFNRFTLAAVVLSEPVIDVIRRELRKVSPSVKIANEEIEKMLLHEVVKRDVVEGEKALVAQKSIAKAMKRASRVTVSVAKNVDPPASEISMTVEIGGANESPTGHAAVTSADSESE